MLIKRDALEFVLGVSRRIYPREFGCLLRGDDEAITEALLIPGSVFGENFTIQRLDMKPLDHSIIGSAHSHPGICGTPSKADLGFFRKFGVIHLIMTYPYRELGDILAYSRDGERRKLTLLK